MRHRRGVVVTNDEEFPVGRLGTCVGGVKGVVIPIVREADTGLYPCAISLHCRATMKIELATPELRPPSDARLLPPRAWLQTGCSFKRAALGGRGRGRHHAPSV